MGSELRPCGSEQGPAVRSPGATARTLLNISKTEQPGRLWMRHPREVPDCGHLLQPVLSFQQDEASHWTHFLLLGPRSQQ